MSGWPYKSYLLLTSDLVDFHNVHYFYFNRLTLQLPSAGHKEIYELSTLYTLPSFVVRYKNMKLFVKFNIVYCHSNYLSMIHKYYNQVFMVFILIQQ